MNDNFSSLFNHYRRKGIFVDSNVLILYFVGTFNRSRISRYKCTQQFIPEDYDLLCQILANFQKIVTTPNVLTEVSNLANKIGDPDRSQCLSTFAESGIVLEESYVASPAIFADSEFRRFGLTDCGIKALAKNRYLVLTDDLRFAVHLQQSGVDTINFNNIRTLGWSL